MVLDYETTKLWIRARVPYLTIDDFEDRYHDTWLYVLEKGLRDGINPLTAFRRIFDTWYSRKQERRREGTTLSLFQSVEPTVLHQITDGWYDEGLVHSSDIELFDVNTQQDFINELHDLIEKSGVLEKLNEFQYEVIKHKLEGYSFDEMAIELKSTPKSVENVWRKRFVVPLREFIISNSITNTN